MCGASFSAACDGAVSAGAAWDAMAAFGRALLAVLLAGAAIKLVDAAADGEPGWDAPACAAYSTALLAVAAALHLPWAGSLMGAAWALGMLGPYGARGRLEGVAAAAVTGAFWGWGQLATSLLALLAVQLADRVVDREGWPASLGPRGQVAATLMAAGVLVVAAGLEPLKAGLVASLTPAAEALAALVGRRRPDLTEVSWEWSS